MKIYCGFDPREAIGYHAFCASVLENTTERVEFAPLHLKTLDCEQRDGTNAFIYSRFLVPYLEGFTGWAIFADACDMVCVGDMAELWSLRDPYKAVQVVQHDYRTKSARKYIGTDMEADNRDYPRKNWSSLMLINCSHFRWRQMLPEMVRRMDGAQLHRFEFIPDDQIGRLPMEWNWLADEYGENERAKLLHWTLGIPEFAAYRSAPMSDKWFEYRP